jgi:hypothetical protein
MTGLVRKATLLGVCGLILAATASANVPDPTKSTVPGFIKVGGTQSLAGVPDPTISYTVTVRDFANNPIAGSFVEINFTNCTDTELCTAVIAGQTVDCTNKAVRATTNASGQAVVTVLGAADNPGTTVPPAIWPGAGAGCVRVYGDGIQLGTATSVTYDQNGGTVLPGPGGGNGVTPVELSISKNDIGAVGLGAAYKGRSDYSTDGALSPVDLSFHKTVVGNSGLGTGSAGGCAGGGVAQPYCP